MAITAESFFCKSVVWKFNFCGDIFTLRGKDVKKNIENCHLYVEDDCMYLKSKTKRKSLEGLLWPVSIFSHCTSCFSYEKNDFFFFSIKKERIWVSSQKLWPQVRGRMHTLLLSFDITIFNSIFINNQIDSIETSTIWHILFPIYLTAWYYIWHYV